MSAPLGSDVFEKLAEIDALRTQALIYLDETPDVTLLQVAGLGSGKTRTVVTKSIMLAAVNYPIGGMVLEPTFPMVRKILLPAYEETFAELEIPWRYHKSDHVVSFPLGSRRANRWAKIQLETGEHPERLKGPSVAYAIGDEAGLFGDDVWRHLPPRVRHPKARLRQFMMTGTPEGFGKFHEWVEGPWSEADRGIRHVYRGSTYDNTKLKPSPAEYIRWRLGHLSPADIERYVWGLFVPSGQRVYCFENGKHGFRTSTDPFQQNRIVVGCDFNVGKMCWVLGAVDGQRVHIFAELVRKNATTVDQCVALWERLHAIGAHWRPSWGGVPRHFLQDVLSAAVDPSAKNRGTRAYESDVQQMRKAGIKRIEAFDEPIPVRDRVASVNWRIREGLLTIDPIACPELKKALEMQGYDKNGEPEKKQGDEDLSGPVDALGYLVWSFPQWRATMPTGNSVVYGSYV